MADIDDIDRTGIWAVDDRLLVSGPKHRFRGNEILCSYQNALSIMNRVDLDSGVGQPLRSAKQCLPLKPRTEPLKRDRPHQDCLFCSAGLCGFASGKHIGRHISGVGVNQSVGRTGGCPPTLGFEGHTDFF